MQRPQLSPLRSRLLPYLAATGACIALWNSPIPGARAAEVPAAPDHDVLDSPVLYALPNGEVSQIGHGGYDRMESDGYEPDFAYLDRSLIGRQADVLDTLVNNEGMPKDINPEETMHFVFKKGELRLRSALDVPTEALEARGTENVSGGVGSADVVEPGTGNAIDEDEAGLDKRQSGRSGVWLTANTCRQPMPNGNATDAMKNSSSARHDTLTNITGVLFDGGYASFELNATSDVYIGIGAPKLEEDWFGSWHFELAASTDGPYHSYNATEPFLYMVDTDSESALFITYDLGDSNKTEDVDKWKAQNPFHIGDSFMPKSQFHVRNLQAAKTYNGFVVVEGSQEPLYIDRVGTTRGGGRVFQAFNWTTKADDSCQVLFDLDFCDTVAYAVPSNTRFKYNDTALATIYDDQAREYYDNFTKSLAQVACDTVSESQYSLARTCDDCAKEYKSWLCMVLMPRCEDWTANDSSLVPRNVKTPFANGSLPDMIPGFNDSAAFARSRNPLIDEVIQPGPYKEMKPCEDMCFDIVRSCPAQMGFSCPNGAQRESMYGRRDPDNDRLTCNFPGAVVKLNANSSGEALGVQMQGVVAVVGIVAAMLLV
ncbi:unnamed protein product [Alternaria alternata]